MKNFKFQVLIMIIGLLVIFNTKIFSQIPVPSAPQLRWQNYERIMFIHFGPYTWKEYKPTRVSRVNPTKLETDQWCQVAKSWGAKMILFGVKHRIGFCWWQTYTSDYGVRNIPWKNGEGDVLAALSESCDKYGLDLGVYLYPGDMNWEAGVGGRTKDTAKQEAYNKVYRQQLTEVLSKYRSMKEVWFDGGILIDVSDILQKYAGDAVIFQGPQATIRWVGNEQGIVPYPNWYTVNRRDLLTGNSTAVQSDPDGDAYAPVEADVPFLMKPKSYKWFWEPNVDSLLLSVPELMDIYYRTVGRGSILLLNATPDTTGLIPKSHVERYKAFGKEIDLRFGKPIVSVSGKGEELIIDLHKLVTINHAIIQEDISQGQRVRKYILEGFSNGKWVMIKEGSSVGSKRIEEFPSIRISKIRLHILEAIATPVIQYFSLYNIEQSSQNNTNNPPENISVTLGGWDNKTFSRDWQDFKLDLTPYFEDKVGQFELKFQSLTRDKAFKIAGSGGYGLEFKDWKIEIYGVANSDAIQKTGDGTFLINHSQFIPKGANSPVVFKAQIRTKHRKSIGTIELKMISFE